MAKENHVGLGGRDPNLFCTFTHPKLDPKTIRLPIAPSGVEWEYVLRDNIIDTYGGQVVQILGVTITNLTISGRFGMEGMWGWKEDPRHRIHLDARFGEYTWYNNNPKIANGIVQLADWFRQYFQIVTQGLQVNSRSFERYQEQEMLFKFPARGWEFYLRPTAFPQLRFANDNIAPEWRIEADFVESMERDRTFLNNVTDLAISRLDALKVGVGFRRENPFSEVRANDGLDRDQLVQEIVSSFSDTVNNFGESEIEELIYNGFTYPTSIFSQLPDIDTDG